ncbi:MAG TPA: ion channel [Rhodopila sp.]|nr:ion channel [Rhodopila sp.]
MAVAVAVADGRYRNQALTTLLVLETFILFVAVPLSSLGTTAPLFGASALGVIVTLTLVVISPGLISKLLAVLSMILAVGGASLRVSYPSAMTIWFGHAAVIVAVLAISLVIGRTVFAPGRVTHHRIQGAVVLYLNIAIAFTSAFRLIAELSPGAFAHYPASTAETVAASDMLSFSFTCLTSTGLGEMLPLHPVARSLANLEAVIGQLYLTILLARLVTLHVAASPERR